VVGEEHKIDQVGYRVCGLEFLFDGDFVGPGAGDKRLDLVVKLQPVHLHHLFDNQQLALKEVVEAVREVGRVDVLGVGQAKELEHRAEQPTLAQPLPGNDDWRPADLGAALLNNMRHEVQNVPLVVGLLAEHMIDQG
jgi:hypothetical protein